jgi:hypothetical protein
MVDGNITVECCQPRNPEDGGDMFSETPVLTRTTRHKVLKASIIDTAMKGSQKTVFFDHK